MSCVTVAVRLIRFLFWKLVQHVPKKHAIFPLLLRVKLLKTFKRSLSQLGEVIGLSALGAPTDELFMQAFGSHETPVLLPRSTIVSPSQLGLSG